MTDLNQKIRELLILKCIGLNIWLNIGLSMLILSNHLLLLYPNITLARDFGICFPPRSQFFFIFLTSLFLQHGFMVESLALWQEDGIWITVLPSDADQIVICL